MKILEKISGQIGDILEEIRNLSKKNPNDAVNKFKLRYINQVITDANKILEKKRMPFEDFIGFNEDDLPSNSVLVPIHQTPILYEETIALDAARANSAGDIFSAEWIRV
jgi:hypothetical protein